MLKILKTFLRNDIISFSLNDEPKKIYFGWRYIQLIPDETGKIFIECTPNGESMKVLLNPEDINYIKKMEI